MREGEGWAVAMDKEGEAEPALIGREEPGPQGRGQLERGPEPLDVDDVDPEPDDHPAALLTRR